MAMNNSKFKAIWNNMNAALQKVYSEVPEDNCMSSTSIHAALVRAGKGRDFQATQGCLNSLVKLGVVAEPDRGCFTRVEVRGMTKYEIKEDEPENKPKEDDMAKPTIRLHQLGTVVSGTTTNEPEVAGLAAVAPAAAPLVKTSDPIDRLTKLAASLRGLADDIESTALDFTEQLQVIEAKTAKLDQLRALLKGIE